MNMQKSKNRTTLRIVLVVVIVVSIFGFKPFTNYLRTRPEISVEDTKTAFVVYEDKLSDYYSELIEASETYKTAEQADEWKAFSSTWMVALTNARPVELNKRIPKECSEEKNALVQANGDMVILWSEYDKLFNGKDINIGKVDELKESIQKTFGE